MLKGDPVPLSRLRSEYIFLENLRFDIRFRSEMENQSYQKVLLIDSIAQTYQKQLFCRVFSPVTHDIYWEFAKFSVFYQEM